MGGSMRNPRLRRIHWLAAASGACLAGVAVPFAPTSFLASSTNGLTPPGPRQSSPVALAGDDRTLVNVNPESNTVTVFDVSSDQPDKLAEIRVGTDPSSVAIDPNGVRAFVTNAFDGTLSIVRLTNPNIFTVSGTVAVGAEPQAAAVSPNGTRLYVANSASNSLMVFDASMRTPRPLATIDLSPFGTAPRAIGITNDGDGIDTDEIVFVALFYGQLRPGKTASTRPRTTSVRAAWLRSRPRPTCLWARRTRSSSGRSGTRDSTRTAAWRPARPGPRRSLHESPDLHHPDQRLPNQLAAVAIHPVQGRAYLVSTGASPNGPFRFNSNAQGLVSAFSTSSRRRC